MTKGSMSRSTSTSTSTSAALSARCCGRRPSQVIGRGEELREEAHPDLEQRLEARALPVENVRALRLRELALDRDVREVDDRLLLEDRLVSFPDHLVLVLGLGLRDSAPREHFADEDQHDD